MRYVWPCVMTIPSYSLLLYLTTLQIRKNAQKGLEYQKVYSVICNIRRDECKYSFTSFMRILKYFLLTLMSPFYKAIFF